MASTPTQLPRIPVIIIGAGFSGIATGAQLKRKLGLDDYVIYERSPEIGGTWWANTYPGCGVDVPSIVYSLSFAPNPNFTKLFPDQPEILTYMKHVARKFNVDAHTQLNTSFDSATWDESSKTWLVSLSNVLTGEKYTRECSVLISAVGGLVNPNACEIPGVNRYEGTLVHTARWRKDVVVDDKEVVVIGNGCSGTQVIPAIAPKVKSLTQFIRSPQFYLPRQNPNIHPVLKWAFKWVPGLQRGFRWILFNLMERGLALFYLTDAGEKARAKNKKMSDDYVERTAPKEYWDLLKPKYMLGCKRRVFDPGYLRTLRKPNIHLTDDPITEILPKGVLTKSGKEVPADVIVLATGFNLNSFYLPIIGREGATLTSHWEKFGGVTAYKSTACHSFPNFFFVFGPNSAVGHTSVLFTIESSIDLVIKVIKPVIRGKAAEVEVRFEDEKEYCDKQQVALSNRVWADCRSYYKDSKGWNFTIYPHSMYRFWAQCAFPSMSAWVYGKKIDHNYV